jgi:hypothetical protein
MRTGLLLFAVIRATITDEHGETLQDPAFDTIARDRPARCPHRVSVHSLALARSGTPAERSSRVEYKLLEGAFASSALRNLAEHRQPSLDYERRRPDFLAARPVSAIGKRILLMR